MLNTVEDIEYGSKIDQYRTVLRFQSVGESIYLAVTLHEVSRSQTLCCLTHFRNDVA
jgi:hypothetical protein